MHGSNDAYEESSPFEYTPPQFTLLGVNRGDRVEMSTSTEMWTHLADKFYDFLRGCGFIVERQQLADHFDMASSWNQGSRWRSRTESDCPEKDCEGDATCDNHARRYGLDPE